MAVYDRVEHDGKPVIVMQYVPGTSPANVLKAEPDSSRATATNTVSSANVQSKPPNYSPESSSQWDGTATQQRHC
ncbi:hypothetical protein [Streptomyces sp. NPDC051994]|uniref:hypothetical protein n=1 Tax=unclassified Streptomyces TaxID=2593676 RepID=UPI00342DBCFB